MLVHRKRVEFITQTTFYHPDVKTKAVLDEFNIIHMTFVALKTIALGELLLKNLASKVTIIIIAVMCRI